MKRYDPAQRPDGAAPSLSFDRRTLMKGGLAVAAAGAAWSSQWSMSPAAAEDIYTSLRDRWCENITAASSIDPAKPTYKAALTVLDDSVAAALEKIDRSSGRDGVFTDGNLVERVDSSLLLTTHNRLRSMAVAWYTPGSRYHRDAAVLVDIKAGLKTIDELVYYVGAKIFHNWWTFKIGSPKRIVDILMLIDTELDQAARDRYAGAIRHFVGDPTRHDAGFFTGSNLVATCFVTTLEGVSRRDSARIAEGASKWLSALEYVKSDTATGPGEGFWGDGSYIAHTMGYTTSYGRVLLNDMASFLALLSGSQWEPGVSSMTNLVTLVDKAFAPVVHDGRMMSCLNGRRVAVTSDNELLSGRHLSLGILNLAHAQIADEPTSQRWRSMVRGWLDRSSLDPYAGASAASVQRLDDLFASGVAAAPEPEDSVVYRNMARAIHRRNRWAFAIAMSSKRIDRYETINGENHRGWHTGSGMTYLYDGDNTQYDDGFWPTVDAYRLAGTTVDAKPMAKNEGEGFTKFAWAGGAVQDAKYSSVGMSLAAATTDLTGKKSWFCFDNGIFCLGSGITGGNGYAVETVVENRNLHESGTNKLIVNGSEWTGSNEVSTTVQWAHLEGVGGYVFPTSASPKVRLKRESRTGRWRDIHDAGSTTALTRKYVSLALQHGSSPSNASYSYFVMPSATREQTQEYSAHRDITVIGHNNSFHAVSQSGTGITMINFWEPSHSVGGVRAEGRCAVVLSEKGGKLKVTVADPMRAGVTTRVTITPKESGYRLVTKDAGVTVVSSGASIVLDVATHVYGASFSAEFTRV